MWTVGYSKRQAPRLRRRESNGSILYRAQGEGGLDLGPLITYMYALRGGPRLFLSQAWSKLYEFSPDTITYYYILVMQSPFAQ